MASGPIASWQIDGETVKTVMDFVFGGAKITADSDCRHEINVSRAELLAKMHIAFYSFLFIYF